MRVNNPIMDKTTATASYTASGFTAAGGVLSLNEAAIILGMVFAALTFVVNWWYQHQRIQMDKERHRADQHFHALRMERLKSGHIDPYTQPMTSNYDGDSGD